ncbi:hypothetical protein GUITHDRAFT_108270 [Guillardia theta CCMP2712]|uniref:Uncharacterized protein n=1 Tax=Guillardia theta (strain CCMP2712) TaxID=905079 RepID=L1JBE0_GUITC|nr:hypothetical protein GUITHDRAFT_108270 [Guillardia theta CCMP2712]EKX45821.1 hypothetical protein GUITHDRAFT_108270 [Guillardia theta CCMP2712]|eukprot:XP_005832801.1 hypothetical protein GUITHDRAFT_108270 [Guillardia theta CCMP2712]
MFQLIQSFHHLRQSLEATYVHPADEGYIGAEENWEYVNKYVQPCYAPTWSEATTEPCSWTPVIPTSASDFHWAGYRSSTQTGPMMN